MEFQDVVTRRRMVRRYDPGRAVPPDVADRIVGNALQGPSAGFSQGFGFLVLDQPESVVRFRQAATPDQDPDHWFAATLDRYARPDKGFTERSDAWWPAPYWDIDTGIGALLMLLTAVDAGLGACFFGIDKTRLGPVRDAFGIPERFLPIGAVTVGYPDEPTRDLRGRRRPRHELVHRGRWAQATS